ncbi:MAG: cadherin-like domain-containing protein, partial [Verrucomicrobiales bacterium]
MPISPHPRSACLLAFALATLFVGDALGKQVIIPRGSTWKYLDDGSDQGNAWVQPGFDDSLWASGRGEFGYGEGDENTRLSFGLYPRERNITAYFRHQFDIPDPSVLPGLKLEILRDDGMVVYLNGIEVGRSNMPAGEIRFDTPAASTALGHAESVPAIVTVAAGLILAGANTLAVEVHQDSQLSSDLSFDLEANDAVGATPPQLEQALLALSSSDGSFAMTNLDLRASDCDTPESALSFTVSGVEAGRFELASAPGVAINSFTYTQVAGGQVRFVAEESRFSRASIAGTLDRPFVHDEISGLVASIQNPGILWAQEDSD